MKQAEFEKLLKRRIQLTQDTLTKKSKEYSSPADKLHNFKEVARIRQSHPSEALQGMMDKHLVSYMDILEKVKNGEPGITRHLLDEKIGDIINYFILQEAIIVEQYEL